MKVEFMDAKPWHVGQIVRVMRPEVNSALTALGLDAHREMHRLFGESSVCRSCLIDGKLVAMWGFRGMMASPTGRVWLVLSRDVLKFPILIVRETRRELRKLLSTRMEIEAIVMGDDPAARRFARFLGFEEVDPGSRLVLEGKSVPAPLFKMVNRYAMAAE